MGIPKEIERRVMKRGATERAVVVVFRRGRPCRVFGFDEYVRMKELPGKVKPWTRRSPKAKKDLLADFRVEGGRVLRPLRRSEFYE